MAAEIEARAIASLQAPTPEQVLQWQALMKRQLKKVRVVPQTHKMLNQL
jgi:organic radical activating enzyme